MKKFKITKNGDYYDAILLLDLFKEFIEDLFLPFTLKLTIKKTYLLLKKNFDREQKNLSLALFCDWQDCFINQNGQFDDEILK